MKKALYFFGSFAALVGCIGGIGYALYSRAYVIAICIAVLSLAAYPAVKGWVKNLLG